jgi:hypothetical protein
VAATSPRGRRAPVTRTLAGVGPCPRGPTCRRFHQLSIPAPTTRSRVLPVAPTREIFRGSAGSPRVSCRLNDHTCARSCIEEASG